MTSLSIVVIAFNEEPAIAATLDAIAMLDDLPAETEIIVVDDGSTDATAAITAGAATADPRIRLISQANAGRGAARARGLAAASGDYIAFIDADVAVPPHWWTTCREALESADACGGTPIPDGDVTFVHRTFRLVPKIRPTTITVSGCNGLYHRAVFDRVAFDPTLRNGEDVALSYAMHAAGLRAVTVPGLTVEHQEHKGFAKSCAWLHESGVGAARQFAVHREVRLPDVVTAGFVATLGAAALAGATRRDSRASLLPLGYVTAASAAHLATKFRLGRTPTRSLQAIVLHTPLMGCYLAGRIRGLFTRTEG
ncbi:MAG: glycosyltransferase [Propionibacteriaceae bacterium]|nr:glycosyltransferase [Propionibacteriaceae bacterium]